MNNQNTIDEQSFEQFLLYLYLTAAYSNYKMEEEELYMMKNKLEKSGLIKPENFDKIYKIVLREYQSHNDYDSLNYINKECSRFRLDKPAREKIYSDIKDIIMADGVQEDSETLQLFKIKKMLDLHLKS
jgi:uncharacterized tellurite resistance protein B-like protein